MIQQWTPDTPNPPPPGAWIGAPFRVYSQWPYLSKSSLQDFSALPELHRQRITGEMPRKDSDAFALGSAVDPWCEDTAPDYVLWTGASRRGKGYDQLKADNPDALILTQSMAATATAMRARLDSHERACEIRDGAVAQLSLVYDDPITGLRLKGRPDLVNLEHGVLADLKTSRTVTQHGFAAAASDYNYHWQAWLYREMIHGLGIGQINECWIIAVQSAPPYPVACRPFDAETLDLAGVEVREQLARYRECALSGHWPGDYDDETPIRLPAWRRTKIQKGEYR